MLQSLGQEFIESGNIRIECNKPVELIFTPDENYHIEKVRFNDKDITDNLQDNGFTIDELEKDSVLSVVFAKKQESGISKTGDSTVAGISIHSFGCRDVCDRRPDF